MVGPLVFLILLGLLLAFLLVVVLLPLTVIAAYVWKSNSKLPGARRRALV